MSDQILDEIDEALHDEKKLNLTADEKDILEDLPEGLNDLMKQLNVEDQEEDINSDQFKEMMGNMLKGLQGGADGDNMNDMFERMNTGGFDQMADKLLMQFMEKDILYQPLLETKANYDQYLETNKTLSPEDYQKYSKQRDCVNALLTQLEKDPSQKEILVQLFEEMQSQGEPPQDIFKLEMPQMPQMPQGQDCVIF